MAWTNLTFAFGSLLTSTKMTQLFDNITAQANGDSGAPQQQTASIADAAVTANKSSALFGTWQASKLINTIYQASTDGIVCFVGVTSVINAYLIGYSDAGVSPTVIRAKHSDGESGAQIFVIFPVKKSDYYKVSLTGTVSDYQGYFLPLGS